MCKEIPTGGIINTLCTLPLALLIFSYLSIGPCDFVDDVCEDNILVVCVAAHLLPLRVLSQTNIIAEEGMADTGRGLVG